METERKKMHVVSGFCAGFDHYSDVEVHKIPLSLFFYSLAKNNGNDVVLHFFFDGNTGYIRQICSEIAEKLGLEVVFETVPDSIRERIASVRKDNRFTWMAWMRYFIPELLPDLKEALYTDCDVVWMKEGSACNVMSYCRDIVDDSHPVAVLRDVMSNSVFTGFMYMDLERMRKTDFISAYLAKANELRDDPAFLEFGDQITLREMHVHSYMPTSFDFCSHLPHNRGRWEMEFRKAEGCSLDEAFRSMETYHIVYAQKYSLAEGDWEHVKSDIVSDYEKPMLRVLGDMYLEFGERSFAGARVSKVVEPFLPKAIGPKYRKDGLHLFMAFGMRSSDLSIMDKRRLFIALCSVLSIAKNTPNCTLHFLYENVSMKILASLSKVARSCGSCDFVAEYVSSETISSFLKGAKSSYLGKHNLCRLVLHDMYPDVDAGIWIDTDVLVFRDMNEIVSEVSGSDGNYFFYGCKEGGSTINAGLMYMDFKKLREAGYMTDLLISMCNLANDASDSVTGVSTTMIDQDIVNVCGCGYLDSRWNICLHRFEDAYESDEIDEAWGMHFTGKSKSKFNSLMDRPRFKEFKKLSDEVCDIIPEGQYSYVDDVRKTDGGRKMIHVEGRPHVRLVNNEKTAETELPSEVTVCAYSSNDQLCNDAIPPCFTSMAHNTNAKCRFILVLLDGVSDETVSRLEKFGSGLAGRYSSELHIVRSVPPFMKELISLTAEHTREIWNCHIPSGFMHEFSDRDIFVKTDVDMIMEGDLAKLVKYCTDRGLGRDKGAFAVRDFYRETQMAEFNFGLSPMSASVLKKAGTTSLLRRLFITQAPSLVDEMWSQCHVCGNVCIGDLPPSWNLVEFYRNKFVDPESFTFGFDYYQFYGNRYRVDEYDTDVFGYEYRKTTKGYHFTNVKPWAGTSIDQDRFIKYKLIAEEISR